MDTQAAAQHAIGTDDPNSDWQLKPLEHAGGLPVAAAALKRILTRPDIEAIKEAFSASDQNAVRARDHYKRVGRLGLYAGTLATIAGAIFLLPVDGGTGLTPVSVLQVAALLLAFLASRWLALMKPFNSWMEQRAQAEIARAELFDTVMQAQEPVRDGELPTLPLQLEYFRRYQLDVQRRYYDGRQAEHRSAAWRSNHLLTFSAVLTGITILIGVAIALNLAQGVVDWPDWLDSVLALIAPGQLNRVVLATGVVASALYGLGVARSLMDLDERNASRYKIVAGNLEFLFDAKLPAARQAAADGDQAAVLKFVQAVQDQISAEHREWISLAQREADPAKTRHATMV